MGSIGLEGWEGLEMEMASLVPFESVRHAVAGSIVYPPGGRFGPRIQQDLQLVLLYTGEMEVAIDGVPRHVEAGRVALLTPGREEAFAFARSRETWHRWIAVHVDPLPAEALERIRSLPFSLPLTEEMNRLADLLLSVQSHTAHDSPLSRSLGLAALNLYPVESSRMVMQREKHPAVHLAGKRIREHYAEDLTLRDLARHAGVSPEHLVRLFRKYENTTPIQYLWECRMRRAVELLVNTGLSVGEVAQACGFKTSQHFARLIKKETGRSPSEIRRTSWSGLRAF